MKTPIACLLIFLSQLVGCAASPRVSAPDLTGDWTFEVKTGATSVTHGAMTITTGGQGYQGTLTTNQGNNVLPVRSLTLDGSDMNLIVESPNGNVVFKGLLNSDGRSFQGTVTYHTGQSFPMSGNKRT